jgi:4-hydroxy-tetrahydrodipicolinate synthase
MSGEMLPDGGWPVVLTPFRDDRSVDDDAVDAYTDWLIELGAAGLFANALSSEMYDLSAAERDRLARRVVARAAGRVPVVASSPVGGSPEQQADAVAAVAATGVDAVVLISSQLAPLDASERDVLHAVEVIIARNPGVDLGVYECPLPFKRLPSLDVVRAWAETGAFTFYKDTSHSVPVMTTRLEAIHGSRMKLYNAAIGSLTPSLRAGAAGLSGYAANIYPDLVAWLCRHYDTPGVATQAVAIQRLLTMAEHAVNLRYPTSAKYFLQHSSRLDFAAISRWKPEVIGAHEGLPLEEFAAYVRDLDLPDGALAAAR